MAGIYFLDACKKAGVSLGCAYDYYIQCNIKIQIKKMQPKKYCTRRMSWSKLQVWYHKGFIKDTS